MKKGFSLIEMVITAGIIGLLMVAVTGIMLNSFRAKMRVRLTDILQQNGSWTISEIRKNILNASATMISGCPTIGVGESVSFANSIDGDRTILRCFGNRIASISAEVGTTLFLTDTNIVVDCTSFVSCDTEPDFGEINQMNFNFQMTVGTTAPGTKAEESASRIFKTEVTLRNR